MRIETDMTKMVEEVEEYEMSDNVLPFLPPMDPCVIAVRRRNEDGTMRMSFMDVSPVDLLAIGVVVSSTFEGAAIFRKSDGTPTEGEAA